jgi:DNA-binding MarR family transcriptional regulator
MKTLLSRESLVKIRKLAQLAADLRRGGHFQITRLTILKSLCLEPAVANGFVRFLAQKAWERVKQGKGHSKRRGTRRNLAHQQMMMEALAGMEGWLQKPNEALRQKLRELLRRMQVEQNEQKPIPFGAVRIIHDWDLLLFEDALRCLLEAPEAAGHAAYHMARHYAERYDSRFPSGLIPKSAPLVQDIVDFWVETYGVDLASIPPHNKMKSTKDKKMASTTSGSDPAEKQKPQFTHRQGQFLAFIHVFCKLHRQGPAETDMVKFFGLTPPSAHGMVVKLEELELVTREAGVARSIRVAVPEEDLSGLENIEGLPW